MKYLGVILDNRLSFDEHVDYLYSKSMVNTITKKLACACMRVGGVLVGI